MTMAMIEFRPNNIIDETDVRVIGVLQRKINNFLEIFQERAESYLVRAELRRGYLDKGEPASYGPIAQGLHSLITDYLSRVGAETERVYSAVAYLNTAYTDDGNIATISCGETSESNLFQSLLSGGPFEFIRVSA
mgnify:CR=1 FL=1